MILQIYLGYWNMQNLHNPFLYQTWTPPIDWSGANQLSVIPSGIRQKLNATVDQEVSLFMNN